MFVIYFPDDLQFCNFMYDYENYRWVHSICSAVKKSVCKKRQEVSDIPPVVYGCSEVQIISHLRIDLF